MLDPIVLLRLHAAHPDAAAALGALDGGFAAVPPNVDAVSRTLGAGPARMLARVHLPILAPSVVTALLIVFVDVMKELPITLLLRPFGVDTLSVWVWQATSESLWEQAAVPSLAMVVIGMIAVGALLVALERGAEVVS
jgi:iron(III) transport system permease protein